MREIKFRGISLDTLKFVYGYGVVVSEEYGCVVIHKHGMNVMQHTAVYPETVGEFTGLKDKNGKDIYEGDKVIVKGTKRVGLYETEIIHEGLGFKLKENKTYLNDYKLPSSIVEVIGNIYETKPNENTRVHN